MGPNYVDSWLYTSVGPKVLNEGQYGFHSLHPGGAQLFVRRWLGEIHQKQHRHGQLRNPERPGGNQSSARSGDRNISGVSTAPVVRSLAPTPTDGRLFHMLAAQAFGRTRRARRAPHPCAARHFLSTCQQTHSCRGIHAPKTRLVRRRPVGCCSRRVRFGGRLAVRSPATTRGICQGGSAGPGISSGGNKEDDSQDSEGGSTEKHNA